MLQLAATSVCALVLPHASPPRASHLRMKIQPNDGKDMKSAMEQSDSIVDAPQNRGGRFSRAWQTMNKGLEADADWLGFIGGRLLDAADDGIYRGKYLDNESPSTTGQRKRVVVLGSGWGANAVLSQLKNADCDVVVVSPRNYFLFTPMLAGAALGTLEPRSIIEPIREANPYATYFEAKATSIDPEGKTVTCESVVCDGVAGCEIRDFELPYDQLVVSVGAATNTFGVKGVKENCLFLKQVAVDIQLFCHLTPHASRLNSRRCLPAQRRRQVP